MSRSGKPEFTEMGIARIARWIGVFIWFPAAGLTGLFAILMLFNFIYPQPGLPPEEWVFLPGLATLVLATIHLVGGAYEISIHRIPWGGVGFYWFVSIVLYSIPGAVLCTFLVSMLANQIWIHGISNIGLVDQMISMVILAIGFTCLAMAYLSGVALRQHLTSKTSVQIEKEALR